MWVDFEAEAPKPKESQQVFAYFKRKAKARFYADENFPERAIALLREMGAKVQTSRQAGLKQTLRRGSTRVRAQERPSGGDM
jgi:hypothetical protein